MNERAKHDADAGPREEPGSSRHLDWAHEVDSQKAQQGHRRGDHPVVAEEARGEITDAAQSFSSTGIDAPTLTSSIDLRRPWESTEPRRQSLARPGSSCGVEVIL